MVSHASLALRPLQLLGRHVRATHWGTHYRSHTQCNCAWPGSVAATLPGVRTSHSGELLAGSTICAWVVEGPSKTAPPHGHQLVCIAVAERRRHTRQRLKATRTCSAKRQRPQQQTHNKHSHKQPPPQRTPAFHALLGRLPPHKEGNGPAPRIWYMSFISRGQKESHERHDGQSRQV